MGVWTAQEGGVTPREVFVDGNKFVAGSHGLRRCPCVEGATQRVIFRPRKSPRRGVLGAKMAHFGVFLGSRRPRRGV